MSDAQLAAALALHTNGDLTRLARLFTTKPATNKDGLVSFLVARACPPLLSDTLHMLGTGGMAILAHAAHGNGLLRQAHRAAPQFTVGSWGSTSFWERGPTAPPSPLLLFFPDGLRMPASTQSRLAALLPGPAMTPLVPLRGAPPGTVVPSDPVSDLEILLHVARSGELESTRQGLTAACAKRLATSLTGAIGNPRGDRLRLDCLLSLLGAAGVYDPHLNHRPGEEKPVNHRLLATLLAAYRSAGWDEITEVTTIRGRTDDEVDWTDPVQRRAALLAVLGRCPVGVWFRLDAFLRHAGATAQIDPLLYASAGVGFTSSYMGSLPELGEAGLDLLRDTWVQVVLYAYLAPLGVIEIATDADAPIAAILKRIAQQEYRSPAHLTPAGTMTAFRLTALGAWLLGTGPEPAAAVLSQAGAGAWSLQSDGTVTGLGQRIAAADRVLFDRLGERLDERTWRLERTALITAIAAGTTAAALRIRLEGLSGQALPELVSRLLDEAQRRATALTVTGACMLVQVTDPLAFDQLLHDRSTAGLCTAIGPAHLAVKPDDLAALRRAARKLGWHLPDHAS
jgi:hypothetical protein